MPDVDGDLADLDPAASSRVDATADDFVQQYAALDPCLATGLGVAGYDDQLTDFSPDGLAARGELVRRTLASLRADDEREPSDHDRVARAVMVERLGVELDQHERGLLLRDLNVLASPLQEIREVFDIMPTATEEDWATIGARLGAVPGALDGYAAALRSAAGHGDVAALRQVVACADEAAAYAGTSDRPGYFRGLVADGGADAERCRDDAAAADAAYGRLASFLTDELAPQAPERDAVGRELYEVGIRAHTGAELDLDETYLWGLDEVARIVAEQRQVARAIVPGGTIAEAVAVLNADPDRRVEGADALAAWLQETADRAVADLADVHFDIPEPVRQIDCKIAPPGGSSGAYYIGPNEDFTRAGSMWWSLPAGQTSFPLWTERTTVFHEGVPGHHLQIAQTVFRRSTLNRFQRLMCDVAGHAEGWALYAERLMDELGQLDDPGDKLGMLDGQLLRAVRVVVDIGMHLELTIPPGTSTPDGEPFAVGETWTADLGWAYMRAHLALPDQTVTDERNRYLGWPGQAPSYKVGERVWLEARADAERRAGGDFSLLDWHRRALDLGPMGLDPLRVELGRIR